MIALGMSGVMYTCSTEAEVQNIPVGPLSSMVYVVNGSMLYMSDGTQWIKQ